MLTRLIIRNYAIIPELDLMIEPGLSVITGETGAGKSILLGALGLAIGRRADFRILPDDESKCIVEAHFDLPDKSLEEIFIKEGLDFDMPLICRREITTGGRSRSFINDTPVQLKLLQEIGGHLIELHQQHDNLALQSIAYQTNVLDILSDSLQVSREYKALYIQVSQMKSELAKTKEIELSSARRKDFLKFQIEELENAKLTSGETEKLEETQNVLSFAESIDHTLTQLQQLLNEGPHSINAHLTTLIKQINSGLYFHLGKAESVKSIAYVENLVAATLFLKKKMPFSEIQRPTKDRVLSTIICCTRSFFESCGENCRLKSMAVFVSPLRFYTMAGKNLMN